jgi:hypothetical protein
MQKKILCIALILGLVGNIQVNAQYSKTDSTYHKWFIGTSLFVLIGNFDTKNLYIPMMVTPYSGAWYPPFLGVKK